MRVVPLGRVPASSLPPVGTQAPVLTDSTRGSVSPVPARRSASLTPTIPPASLDAAAGAATSHPGANGWVDVAGSVSAPGAGLAGGGEPRPSLECPLERTNVALQAAALSRAASQASGSHGGLENVEELAADEAESFCEAISGEEMRRAQERAELARARQVSPDDLSPLTPGSVVSSSSSASDIGED